MIHSTATGPGLPFIELRPEGAASFPVIIGLHGFGADKADLTGLADALDPSGYTYLFPDAPTLAFDDSDPTMRAWYERGGDESLESVVEAISRLNAFLEGVRARLGERKMVLIGFSQGGAMALRYGLPRPDWFAGLAILSGSLRRTADLTATLPAQRDLPLHVSHGRIDTVVPLEVSRSLVRYLEGQGYRPDFRIYGSGHFIVAQQMADLRGWLHAVLPPGPS